MEGRACSSGGGSRSREEGGAWVVQVALGGGSGSALPGSCAFYAFGVRSWLSLAVAAGGTRVAGQTRPPPLPFPRVTWLGPLPQIFTGAREKQRVTTARGSSLLRPSAQPAVCGGAGVLPVWQDCGVGREQNPGRRASVVPPGASRGFPSVVLPSLSLISADLPPSRGLWPGPDCRGPSHPRCRVVRVPPPVPTCHPDKKLKSVCGGESDAMKLRPVAFHVVQRGPGLGTRVGLGLRKAWEAESNCLHLSVTGLRWPRCVSEPGKGPGRRERADPRACLQPPARHAGGAAARDLGVHRCQSAAQGARRGEAPNSCPFTASLLFLYLFLFSHTFPSLPFLLSLCY